MLSDEIKFTLALAFKEAKKRKLSSIDTKFLFYMLLKRKNLLTKTINQLNEKTNSSFPDTNQLLSRCELALKEENSNFSSSVDQEFVNLTKGLRHLLYEQLRISRTNSSIVTTKSIFLSLRKNKSFNNWFQFKILRQIASK